MSESRLKRTVSSALWSAYGDALGFPTELASEDLVKRRVGQTRSTRTGQWKRLVGGNSVQTSPCPQGLTLTILSFDFQPVGQFPAKGISMLRHSQR